MKSHEEFPEIFKAYLSIGWLTKEDAEEAFDEWFNTFKPPHLKGKTPREVVEEGGEELIISMLIALADGAYI